MAIRKLEDVPVAGKRVFIRSDLNVPILMDFPAGHEIPNLTLPIGTEVELVVEETTGWLQYREDALEAQAAGGS